MRKYFFVQQQISNRKIESGEIYILILHLSLVGFSFLEAAAATTTTTKSRMKVTKEEITKI
jgi:hypothetical protein